MADSLGLFCLGDVLQYVAFILVSCRVSWANNNKIQYPPEKGEKYVSRSKYKVLINLDITVGVLFKFITNYERMRLYDDQVL